MRKKRNKKTLRKLKKRKKHSSVHSFFIKKESLHLTKTTTLN